MEYLIYDPKQKKWGAVLKKQRLGARNYYQINFDNNLKKEDEPHVPMYTEDLKLAKFSWYVRFKFEKENEVVFSSKLLNHSQDENYFNSPEAAWYSLNEYVAELKKTGHIIIDSFIKPEIDD